MTLAISVPGFRAWAGRGRLVSEVFDDLQERRNQQRRPSSRGSCHSALVGSWRGRDLLRRQSVQDRSERVVVRQSVGRRVVEHTPDRLRKRRRRWRLDHSYALGRPACTHEPERRGSAGAQGHAEQPRLARRDVWWRLDLLLGQHRKRALRVWGGDLRHQRHGAWCVVLGRNK